MWRSGDFTTPLTIYITSVPCFFFVFQKWLYVTHLTDILIWGLHYWRCSIVLCLWLRLLNIFKSHLTHIYVYISFFFIFKYIHNLKYIYVCKKEDLGKMNRFGFLFLGVVLIVLAMSRPAKGLLALAKELHRTPK